MLAFLFGNGRSDPARAMFVTAFLISLFVLWALSMPIYKQGGSIGLYFIIGVAFWSGFSTRDTFVSKGQFRTVRYNNGVMFLETTEEATELWSFVKQTTDAKFFLEMLVLGWISVVILGLVVGVVFSGVLWLIFG